MQKYRFFILLMALTLILNFTLPKAEASTLPDINTVKKMTRAVGETMGIKWTVPALVAVAGKIVQDADFWGNFGSIPDTVSQQKVLDSDQFKKYIGEINDTVALETVGSTLPLYGECGSSPVTGVQNGTGLEGYVVYKDGSYWWTYAFATKAGYPKAHVTYSQSGSIMTFTADQPVSYTVKRTSSSFVPPLIWDNMSNWTNGSTTSPGDVRNFSGSSGAYTVYFDSQATTCNYTITSNDVADISGVSPILSNPTTNYNYYTTYVINYPDSSTDGTDSIGTPWNQPLTSDQLGNMGNVEPTEKPTGSSWWQWLFKPLFDFLNGITDLFSKLFVPDGDSITNQFADLSDSFKAKLPITGQLGDFWSGLKGSVTDGEKVPKFEMSFPKDWGGGTYSIIDFSYFADYRTWILNFIRFSAWFLFLKRLYNKIASLI